ncbi:hypothetical protein BH23BAC3_BH23BAC3_19600 [soil metagenome]
MRKAGILILLFGLIITLITGQFPRKKEDCD